MSNKGRFMSTLEFTHRFLPSSPLKSEGIFRKIEEDNCLLFNTLNSFIDNKAKFYCRKAGDYLPWSLLVESALLFFSQTHEITVVYLTILLSCEIARNIV